MSESSNLKADSGSLKYRINAVVCLSCSTCYKECRFNAVSDTEHGYRINDNCVGCGICAKACPIGAIHPVQLEK